jgi:hypothetical protein
MANLYDAKGRPIMRGDILKVFHFIGARGKRHYMYKQALDTVMLGKSDPKPWLKISHLELTEEHYHEREDGRTLCDYEIVQSKGADFIEDRPRANAATPSVSVIAREEDKESSTSPEKPA